jgi:uncharacterized protein (TIGR02145 family)
MKHIYSVIFLLLFYIHGYAQQSCPGIPTVTYSGKTYNTVQIGTQCWLKENLNVGTMINSSTAADSMRNNGIIEKYCYNNDSANCTTYGGLYQWDEAMQYVTKEKAIGICPNNWHIATYAELQACSTAVNGDGNSLKAIGQGTGTNTSGFSALLTGGRYSGGDFNNLGFNTIFWSSTVYSALYTNIMFLNYNLDNINFDYYSKTNGFSVRCIKDNPVGIDYNEKSGLPKEFLLLQNYPNPFNPSTTIKFSLPKESHVTLSIYNSIGQEVAKLISTDMNAGAYTMEWNASGFASGVYYYRIVAGGLVQTKKLILLK